MNSPYYRSEEGPPTNKRSVLDDNETRTTYITPARLMSSGADISIDGSQDEKASIEIKEVEPRKFEGDGARSSAVRRSAHKQRVEEEEDEEQKEGLTKTEQKQQKALSRRNIFLQELHAKEKEEFEALEKRSNISKVKFLLEQADTFMNFILDVKKGPRRPFMKDTAITKFFKKGLTAEDLKEEDNGQEIEPTRLLQQPANLRNGVLKEYQLDAVNWLIGLYEKGLNGILADQMGLGKTIVTIAFIAYLRTTGIKGPYLIVVPLSTFYNWQNEFKKWCPEVRLFMLRAIKEREIENKERFKQRDYDVIITSYEGCISMKGSLARRHFFKAIVIDEAHRLKNEETLLSTKIRGIKSMFRMLLTGTPMQNTLRELWALLNYIFPDIFANAEEFEGMLDTSITKGRVLEQQIMKLHRILSFFMLRRTKADVLSDLPPKKEYIIKIPLSQQQVKLYRRAIVQIGREGEMKKFKNILMQLRKVCQHPYLFEQEIPDGQWPIQVMIRASNKLAVLDRLLQKFKREGHQVLIFSQFVMWIEELEYYLEERKYNYCKLIGNTDIEERQEQIEAFNKKGSKYDIFVLSTRAGGLGINLTSASKVIIYDSDFNPHVDIQAIDRCHRIGQTKEVEVFRLVAKDTIEENMIERQIVKLRLDELIVQQGRLAPRFKKLSNVDLQSAILYGADRFINNAVVPQNLYDDKQFDLEAVLKESEKLAKGWRKKVEEEIKDKLNDEILEDLELTYEKIQCLNQQDQKEREQVKARIKKEFLENITKPSRYRERATFHDPIMRGPMIVKPRKLKPWQFPKERERLIKLLEDYKPEDDEEIDAIENTGFINWSIRDAQALIKGIREEGLKNITALSQYVPKKKKGEIKEYVEVMMARKGELDGTPLLKQLENALRKYNTTSESTELLTTYVTEIYEKEEKERVNTLSYISPLERALLVLTYEIGYGSWQTIKKRLLYTPRYAIVHAETQHIFETTAWIKEKVDGALHKLMRNQFQERGVEDQRENKKKQVRSKSKSRAKSQYLDYPSSEDERESVIIPESKQPAKRNKKNGGSVRKKK